MAEFAPIPSASVSTATVVKPGFFSSWRRANSRSLIVSGQWSVASQRSVGQSSLAPNGTHHRRLTTDKTVSFITQRLHGIDIGGTARRQPTRQDYDDHDYQ